MAAVVVATELLACLHQLSAGSPALPFGLDRNHPDVAVAVIAQLDVYQAEQSICIFLEEKDSFLKILRRSDQNLSVRCA